MSSVLHLITPTQAGPTVLAAAILEVLRVRILSTESERLQIK